MHDNARIPMESLDSPLTKCGGGLDGVNHAPESRKHGGRIAQNKYRSPPKCFLACPICGAPHASHAVARVMQTRRPATRAWRDDDVATP
jgi:hypothetical protein